MKEIYGLAESDPGIFRAIQRNDLAAVRASIDKDPSAIRLVVSATSATPLIAATEVQNLSACKVLLESGADPNSGRDTSGQPPLHVAALGGDLAIGRLLLEAGANVNAKESGDTTPLHNAARYCGPDFVEMLLRAGAEANAKNYSGATPAIMAAHAGRVDVMRVLVAHGADLVGARQYVNVGGPFQVALTAAAEGGHEELLEYLLKGFRWPVEAKNVALKLAASEGHLAICKALVAAAAEPFAAAGADEKSAYERIHCGRCTRSRPWVGSRVPSAARRIRKLLDLEVPLWFMRPTSGEARHKRPAATPAV